MEIKLLDGEYWYGGCVEHGVKQPFGGEDTVEWDLSYNPTTNQAMPLFLSTQGRYLWRDTGFPISLKDGILWVADDVLLSEGHGNLKGAYLSAMQAHFPFHQITLEDILFSHPQYNSWIELTFDQNEQDILKYAHHIVEHGMPAGVLMIDDGWSEYFGNWKFNPLTFPHPEAMLQELKALGFQVMLWLCPFISPDTVTYREAKELGILIRTAEGKPYICEWWDGYSAVLDMSNPKACQWLDAQLEALMKLGVGGFKFDAGDSYFYPEGLLTYGNTSADEQSRLWAAFGEKYTLNEYRASFRAGGMSLMQRLSDKRHAWGDNGLSTLLPNTLLQGLTGHPFTCPDMIGGGEFMSFRAASSAGLDEELFCRHSEAACMLPAMQFSAAPWRVLSKERFAQIQKSVALREKHLSYLMEVVQHAKITGEPIVRYMEYEFPHQGMEKITTQFLLGDKLLVAPILEKGQLSRMVWLPAGDWEFDGQLFHSIGQEVRLTPVPGEPIVLRRLDS